MKDFKSPLIAMLATTGNPTRQEISDVLDFYLESDIYQVLLYPRDGCEIEYLSDRWFEFCNDFITLAEEKGMGIWLYDDYNWPSGQVKGKLVEENPDFGAKHICVTEKDGVLNIELKTANNFSSLLSFDAMKRFIELTHEAYYRHFSKYFGSTILGIFTDEPSYVYPHLYAKDAFYLPYYDNLSYDIQRATGKSLNEYITENYLSGRNPESWTVYYSLIAKRFKESYFEKLRTWCDNHNIFITGHLLIEDIPYASAYVTGNPLTMLSQYSLPGIDEIHTWTTNAEYLTFATGEYAISKSGNGGIAELFALGPCDMPLSKVRQMIWLAALHKVDKYLLAVSAYDAKGNMLKNAHYNPHCYTQPWCEAYSSLGADAAEAARFAHKTSVCQIELRHPLTISINSLNAPENQKRINSDYMALIKSLVHNQNQWHLINENDEASAKLVFSLTENGYYEEISGKAFTSLYDVESFIKARVENSVTVTENGVLPENILVKCFTDESYAVLDMTDGKDNYFSRAMHISSDKELDIVLYGRSIFTSDSKSEISGDTVPLKNDTLKLDLSNQSLLRCKFKDNSFNFTCGFDMESSLVIRSYQNTGKFYLDGKIVDPCNSCTKLTRGLNSLYTETNKMILSKGVHTIAYDGNSLEVAYLPLCFVSGDFSVSNYGALMPIPERVKCGNIRNLLEGFAGKARFSLTAFIPSGKNLYLSANTYGLYTKLYIDGEFIGEKLWEPFTWQIPDKFSGKSVTITFEEATSIAPIFGNSDFLRTFRALPSGNYSNIGVSDMKFIIKAPL
ncbi:MAG: hypothetical protein Q8882_04875 [Bacillota bacterium]|nr:hypothetical protein [Bacillota bacterium]